MSLPNKRVQWSFFCLSRTHLYAVLCSVVIAVFLIALPLGVSAQDGETSEPDVVEERQASQDSDRDGLADDAEAANGSDPNNPDTDGDGVDDLDEVLRGTDPLNGDDGEIGDQSQEVLIDERLSLEDLGGETAVILPDSPIYFLKRWGRGINEAFTFDPIKDAKLKLQHANQELSEVKQMIDFKGIENVSAGAIVRAQ